MKTELLGAEGLDRAAELIKSGELVAVPTETVYGLACSGLNADAVAEVYEVKGRPEQKPLSLMVHKGESMERYCISVPAQAKALAEKFWPGPLTIVLNAKTDIVPDIVRAGGETVALRCPDHPLTQKLLEKAGLPFAAPSANPSGEKSPVTARQVMDYFDGKISAVVDGGECGLGKESTIIDMSRTPFKVLRQGALPERDIAEALSQNLTVIGITGGTGCGKTTALNVLRDMGVLIIDCDALYHEMLLSNAEMLNGIATSFPGTVKGGVLDRRALAEAVFSDKEKLKKLNAITHHYVTAEIDARLRDWAMQGGTAAAVDAIAIIEGGIASRCSATVAVVAEKETRISRIMRRDNITRAEAESRVAAQKPNEFFEANCGYVLHNDGSGAEFVDQCKILFKEVLKNE